MVDLVEYLQGLSYVGGLLLDPCNDGEYFVAPQLEVGRVVLWVDVDLFDWWAAVKLL